MGKRRRIVVAALVLAVLGGFAWVLFLRPPPEPVYQGKRLSEWLASFHLENRFGTFQMEKYTAARDALRHIGTNAIPTLLRMLRARDSALTLKLIALANKQHFIKIHYTTAASRRGDAVWAFGELGDKAKDAAPALAKILDENISPDSRLSAVLVLGYLGPAAREALPSLLRVASDTNNPSSEGVAVRAYAIEFISGLHAQPELVVPALTRVLSDATAGVRATVARALGEFGADAKPAVPRLFELLKDQDPLPRLAAAQAIRKIDPEAAELRKAEIEAALAPEKR